MSAAETPRVPTTADVRTKYATVLDPHRGWKHSEEWALDFDAWLAARDARRDRAHTSAQVAKAIWAEEQRCQASIAANPFEPHLAGRLTGLQRARDIAEGMGR